MLKYIKYMWNFFKWQRSDECKLFELLLELRSEALTNNFKKFDSKQGICGNTHHIVHDTHTLEQMQISLMTEFVNKYPHAPDVVVDKKYLRYYYPVEGNPKSYYESNRINQLWFNPRRLQLLDFMIMKLYNTKPEL